MRGVPGTARCGTNGGYSRHMRLRERPCAPCRRARNAYNKRLRYRQHVTGGSIAVDATGTRRRVQALARLGHRFSDIAAHMGVPHTVVSRFGTAQWVQVDTAERVRQVYERLSGTPGTSDVTRSRAIAKGWPPPLDWEGRDVDNPRALSHSQVGDLLRAAHAARAAA